LQGRARAGSVKKYLDARGLRILQALDEVSARERVTQAQVALAWLLAQPSVAAPIVSATSVAQLEDILGAARLKLSASDLDVLDSACG
jgi:aryl-alcohol dehydrogenase-like predicted oxidoreductase